MPTPDFFMLSRLYAKGWVAGADHASDDSEGDLAALADGLNPGKTRAERARWHQGFTEAIERNRDRPAKKTRSRRALNPRPVG